MVRLQLCPASMEELGGEERQGRGEQQASIPPIQLIGEERQPPVLTQGSLLQSQPIIDKAVSTRPA